MAKTLHGSSPTAKILVACWVVALLSAATGAGADWHLTGTYNEDAASSWASNHVTADGPMIGGAFSNLAPDLKLIAVREYFKDRQRDRLVFLSASGEVLSTFSPGLEWWLSPGVWLNSQTDEARVLVFPWIETEEGKEPDPDKLPSGHLLSLDVKTGKTVRDLTLEKWAQSFRATRDGREMLIYSRNHSMIAEDGKVLCRLGTLDDPLPEGAGATDENDSWAWRLAPQGGFLIAVAPNGRDIYQVTDKGERYWELHLSDLFGASRFAPEPLMSATGRYLLIGNGLANNPVGKFTVAPKNRREDWSIYAPQAEGVFGQGWSLTLIGIRDETLGGVPGGEGRIVWATLQLRGRVGEESLFSLGPIALKDRGSLVTVAAWESRGIWVWDITPKGKVEKATRITPNLPPGTLNKIHLAGDPPILLVPYQGRGEPKEVGAVWLSTDGKELFRWSAPGTDCQGWLSTDGHRAVIRSHTAVYFFSDE